MMHGTMSLKCNKSCFRQSSYTQSLSIENTTGKPYLEKVYLLDDAPGYYSDICYNLCIVYVQGNLTKVYGNSIGVNLQ
jgi:hypothetical protein